MQQPRIKIKIKHKQCRGPIECGIQCVKACPYHLLAYTQNRTPNLGEEPTEFKIIVAFPILCNNCGRCVAACPDNAIKVTSPEG
jgi:ferredoxin